MKTITIGMFCAGALCGVSHAAKPPRPNVIIILTDDQGYGDLSCHGNPVLKTPNLDRLHSESIRLTDFHVSPCCSPTRAALMTGRDPVRVGIWTTITDMSVMFAGEKTMADVFAANGYRTAMFGKWHLGDTPPYRPNDRGFQEALWEPGGVTGAAPGWWNNECWDDTFSRNGKPEKTKGLRVNVWFDEAMKWMDRCGSEGKPFFIYLATPEAHAPYRVPDEYSAPYRALDREGATLKTSEFFGTIAMLDENIGRLEAYLAKNGLRDDTLLVFMTDNGGTAGVTTYNAGMKGRKGEYYEGGHRVPCFVRWPAGGMAGGRDIDELAVHKDWFPTLIDLCGLNPPKGLNLEGVSLESLLAGKTNRLPERDIVVKWGPGWYTTADILTKTKWNGAVLSGKWRLVNGEELYDVSSDPGQSKNVAGKHPETVQKLRAVYEQYWSEVYPACFEEERPTLIGRSNDEEVMLTCAHWRAESEESCRLLGQGAIRAGKPGQGFWSLNIERGGVYEFALQRWPKEADLPIRGIAPAVIQGHFIKFLRGTMLPIASAKIRIGDEEKEVKVSDTDKAAVFRLLMQPGNTRLRTAFLDSNGKELCGAYYVYVRRIEG